MRDKLRTQIKGIIAKQTAATYAEYDDVGYWQAEMMRLQERQKTIDIEIADYELIGCPHHSKSLWLWQLWSNDHALPVDGGVLAQPAWFWNDCQYFDLLSERDSLSYRLKSAKDRIRQGVKK